MRKEAAFILWHKIREAEGWRKELERQAERKNRFTGDLGKLLKVWISGIKRKILKVRKNVNTDTEPNRPFWYQKQQNG